MKITYIQIIYRIRASKPTFPREIYPLNPVTPESVSAIQKFLDECVDPRDCGSIMAYDTREEFWKRAKKAKKPNPVGDFYMWLKPRQENIIQVRIRTSEIPLIVHQ